MPEKIRGGQYQVGEVEPTDSREGWKNIGVIKGETANDLNTEAFRGFISQPATKWFVYETEELRVHQRGTTSDTFVRLCTSFIKECDTKQEAVDKAKQRYDF